MKIVWLELKVDMDVLNKLLKKPLRGLLFAFVRSQLLTSPSMVTVVAQILAQSSRYFDARYRDLSTLLFS